ncbi:MAG: UDP-N-acetylmuramoyl-L-alanyl-D-glutamate--2,6-diaminopimelate ligase, partial [Hyphomicrobiaceae bacterium]|nr:UDP-N-acetylmuramoyl-L-alanyl-D-glutamate--2,6-diaminopimelate ligase [Hyphomicrobiaceae bacterium]
GTAFVAEAVSKGAAAVLIADGVELPGPHRVPVLRASEPRLALARIASRFHGPGPDTIVAVTGTSGKTSVVEFTRQIFAHLGLAAASLGTLGVVSPRGSDYGSLTTPDPVTLAATLAQLRAEGVTHLAMEASSHGLDQRRLDGVALTAGAFTNLGRDHLDYHPTVDDYLAAKLGLFERLLRPGQPVAVNMDGGRSADAAAAARQRGLAVIEVGRAAGEGEGRGDSIRLLVVEREGFQQRLRLSISGREVSVTLPLLGAYQVENALTAAGLALAAGAPEGAIVGALEALNGVPGRLDVVGSAKGGIGVVDYAHKPEALAACLDALRPFATGRLICVFGCGGDRDRGKRPIMGRIAVEKADCIIVTDDNPRTEDPAMIRAEIMAGTSGLAATRGTGDIREIADRATAIQSAVADMGPGDVVVVAGKGHETGQIVGATVLPFSDHKVLHSALAAREAA